MSHYLLDSSQEYAEETFQEVKTRYTEFGKNLYDILRVHEPEIFMHLRFYKATKLIEKTTWGQAETENSYAVYDDKKVSFGIQLEPMKPVICLHNKLTQVEIGDLNGNDYCRESIEFIKKELLKNENPS